ncbi:MAG: hypothetical protein R2909_00035 [Gemmatimonadales bacterium]
MVDPAPPAVGEPGPMLLEYLASVPVVAQGAATGREYRFQERGSRASVARADGPALLATSFFRRVD